ncbi:MAG: helix-turn-helix transcriptional regulator [Oscillospiraceae bacterium]|nr:helix-turn-helix transcriptional regulator [Oscillospiraceae bacterium]
MKRTDDLQQELMASEDLDRFLSENEDSFEAEGAGPMLRRLYETSDISKAELARRSGMSTVYLYQVFSGSRRPSRDRMLCLCFGLGCPLETIQKLLKKSGYSPLYPKIRRDVVILYAFDKGLTLQQVNDRLFQAGEETLC